MRPRVAVVGSGPNGLVAGLVLQAAGCRVRVYERQPEAGGGLSSAPLTRPGHMHDVCAAVHPLAAASPFLRRLPLRVSWIHPPAALAHPFDDGSALLLWPDLERTAAELGPDGRAYIRLLAPLVDRWERLAEEVLAPPHRPRAPVLYARFAWRAARPARALAQDWFREDRTRTLLAGLAAHGTVPLERWPTAAFGVVLAVAAHTTGWPLVAGGSGELARALAGLLRSGGGELETGTEVASLAELGDAAAVVLDVAPGALPRLAGGRQRAAAAAGLRRVSPGCGVHKVDWALSSPVPWRAAECALAGTVHLGGSESEIAAALSEANSGRDPSPPFVLFGQPTQFDGRRAPPGEHNAWAYCAVPAGSARDYTAAIEAQVERFAPGFRDLVLARRVRTAAQLEEHNPNLVGGSLAGTARSAFAFFFGPFRSFSPYRTPLPGVYLCSAATPPGPGVHGMCGYHAAQRVLSDLGMPAGGLYPPEHLSKL